MANPCRQETQKRAPNRIGREDAYPRHYQYGSRGGSTLRGVPEDEVPNNLLQHYRQDPVQSARKGERGERAGGARGYYDAHPGRRDHHGDKDGGPWAPSQ